MADARLSDKSWVSFPLLFIILTCVLSGAAAYWSLSSAITVHCVNPEAHHSTAYLQETYVTRAEYSVMQRQLDRIESKTDKLLDMHLD